MKKTLLIIFLTGLAIAAVACAFGYRWYLRRHLRYTVDRSQLD